MSTPEEAAKSCDMREFYSKLGAALYELHRTQDSIAFYDFVEDAEVCSGCLAIVGQTIALANSELVMSLRDQLGMAINALNRDTNPFKKATH